MGCGLAGKPDTLGERFRPPGHGAAPPPAVLAVLAPQILPAITASRDLPVGPEGLIDSVSAKFERFVMDQIRADEQVCAAAKQQLTNCEQQFQKVAHRAAERWATAPDPGTVVQISAAKIRTCSKCATSAAITRVATTFVTPISASKWAAQMTTRKRGEG